MKNNRKITDKLLRNNLEEKETTLHVIELDEKKYKKIEHKIPREIKKADFLSMFINKLLSEKNVNYVIKEYVKSKEKKGWLPFQKS
ncbi:MAG: hypothetical protein AABY22_00880 [Nanoarchaeota archaeon]